MFDEGQRYCTAHNRGDSDPGRGADLDARRNPAALEQEPEATAELAQGDDAAQDTMYEGALAGLTEEEIAKMALAEEESSERQSDIGAEDSVD